MIRTAILAACLASCLGCTASRQVTNGKPVEAEAPKKEYEYRDMSTGATGFRR